METRADANCKVGVTQQRRPVEAPRNPTQNLQEPFNSKSDTFLFTEILEGVQLSVVNQVLGMVTRGVTVNLTRPLGGANK